MQENGSGDIDGVGVALRQRVVQVCPARHAVRRGFLRITRYNAGEAAARFSQNSRQNTLGGDVANADDQPGNKTHVAVK